jgi:adenylate cyclase
MTDPIRNRLLVSGGLALAIGALLAAAYQFSFFSTAQLRSTDFLFIPREGERARSTVIVGIDQRSSREVLAQHGAMVSWPRTYYARAVDVLAQAGARVIVLDFFLFAPRPEDPELIAAMRGAGNVITPVEAQGPKILRPSPGVAQEFDVVARPTPAIKEAGAAEGLVNVRTDQDAVIRTLPLLLRVGDADIPSMALTAVARFIRRPTVVDAPAEADQVHAAGRTIPVVDGGNLWINFLGPPSGSEKLPAFPVLSFVDVLNGSFDRALVKDKIVLIGLTIRGLDEFSTPTTSQGRMWGVEVLANAIETIVGERYLVPASRNVTIGLIFLMALSASALVVIVRPFLAALGVLGLVALYLLAAILLFDHGTVLNLVYPLGAAPLAFAGSMVYRVIYEQAEQARLEAQRAILMQLFSRHVSKEIAEAIWQHREQFLTHGRLRSQQVMVTVLFTDLKGFTPISEKLDPQGLIDWLNMYMEKMSQFVIDHGGVIDDFAGDSIKADFGTPVPRTTEAEIAQDAVNAVNCALVMEWEMRRLNIEWVKQGLPTVGMRVGINTGPAVAGSLGGTQRMKYTTIGDTVNIASRLESFDKEGEDEYFAQSPCRILISDTTLQYLGDQFITKPIGDVSLKGKGRKITVHRVLGRKDGAEPAASIRKAVRVKVDTTVGVSDDTITVQATVRDLSTGGVSVHDVALKYDKGKVVRLHLPVPTAARSMDVDAKVAWSTENQAGLTFHELTPEAQAAIEEFLAGRLPVPSEKGAGRT